MQKCEVIMDHDFTLLHCWLTESSTFCRSRPEIIIPAVFVHQHTASKRALRRQDETNQIKRLTAVFFEVIAIEIDLEFRVSPCDHRRRNRSQQIRPTTDNPLGVCSIDAGYIFGRSLSVSSFLGKPLLLMKRRLLAEKEARPRLPPILDIDVFL